jgi:hypothetical protein
MLNRVTTTKPSAHISVRPTVCRPARTSSACPKRSGIFTQGAALGGARPKATVRDEIGALQLAKFSSHGDRFDVPAVEYATLRLAEGSGLRVPASRLVQVNDRNVFVVRRFDCYWAVPGDTTPKGTAGSCGRSRRWRKGTAHAIRQRAYAVRLQ